MALERFKNVTALAEQVGLYLSGAMRSSFTGQGRSGIQWNGRAVPNRIGILLDLKAGKPPPTRRFDARPAGSDTGALRRSVTYSVSGNTVTVGSKLNYASDVQRGSTKTIQVDDGLKKAISAWLKGLKGAQQAAARKSFGFMLAKGFSAFTTQVPARPFVTLCPEDRKRISELARAFFANGGKP